jgi:hypothetical protein
MIVIIRAECLLEPQKDDSLSLEPLSLQASIYGLKGCRDRALFAEAVTRVEVLPFEPREGVKIAVSDEAVSRIQVKCVHLRSFLAFKVSVSKCVRLLSYEGGFKTCWEVSLFPPAGR